MDSEHAAGCIVTIVKVKIGPVTAETDGETWSSSDKTTEDLLNTGASPREVEAGHMYVPDMAQAMADLAKRFFRDLEIVSIEEEEEIPENVVF